MDSKHQENYLKKYDEKSLEKLQSRLVFTDTTYLFIFKKTEKVIAAIYLVTNLISDSEPIKWQIRKISLGLMSDILTLKRLPTSQAKQTIVGLVATVSEIVSLLKISFVSENISSMNHSVLQRELVLLMDNLESLHLETVGNGSVLLPQDFFNVPMLGALSNAGSQPSLSKGQYRTSNGQKDSQSQQAPKDNLNNLKDNRRDSILKLVKDGKSLGVKDFSKEIKGCSEKTIQRELLSMVENGVLKKTGERRWSLYSLA